MKIRDGVTLVFLLATLAMKASFSPGDLVLVNFKISPSSNVNNGFIGILAREPIPAGTTIGLTNKFYYSGAFGSLSKKGGSGNTNFSSSHGYVEIVLNENLSVGESFILSFSGSTVSSTKGTATISGVFDFGGTSGESQIVWLYTGSLTSPTVVSGLMYHDKDGSIDWDDNNDLPTGISFSGLTGCVAPFTALNLDINGNSVKCGSWYQGSNTSVDLTAGLNSTFYTKSNWIFATTNSIDPCVKSDVENNILNFLNTSIVFNEYNFSYGKKRAGLSSIVNANRWYVNGVLKNSAYQPPWSKTSCEACMDSVRQGDFYIYSSLTLGSFLNSSSSNTLERFDFGKLKIIDTTGLTDTKLSISPGDVIVPNYSITMTDWVSGDGKQPKVGLSSNVDANGAIHYAQIASTTAVLNGRYEYQLYISQPGWHRIYSPISRKWSGVGISGSSFQFKYGASGATRNIYFYDASGPQINGSTSFWQYVDSTDNASDRPVNIYFAPGGSETPCILTFKGALKYPDLDNETKLSSSTTSNALNSSSPGYGAPWYGNNYNGWNLYGNHGLTFLKVADIKSNYYDLTQMSNLSMSVYVWDPYKNGTIGSAGVSNYYSHNGQTGDALAEYIPPFTAFFMRTTSPGSNGYVVGRKAMSAGQHTGISNKTGNTIGLTSRNNLGVEQNVYASPIPEFLSNKSGLNYNAVSSGLGEGMLFIHEDSSFFRIRQTEDPIEYREFPVAFTSSDHGGGFTIANHMDFPEGLNSYLVDLKMQKIHDLGGTDYSFVHDTAFGCDRFKWILSKTTVKLEEYTTLDQLKVFVDAHGSIRILNCEGSGNIDIYNEVGALIETVLNPQNTNELIVQGAANWPSGIYIIKSATGNWQKVFIP